LPSTYFPLDARAVLVEALVGPVPLPVDAGVALEDLAGGVDVHHLLHVSLGPGRTEKKKASSDRPHARTWYSIRRAVS